MKEEGITKSIIKEEGREVTFQNLKKGQFFRKYLIHDVFESTVSIKTGKKTALNLDFGKSVKIKGDSRVIRIRKFNISQTTGESERQARIYKEISDWKRRQDEEKI